MNSKALDTMSRTLNLDDGDERNTHFGLRLVDYSLTENLGSYLE